MNEAGHSTASPIIVPGDSRETRRKRHRQRMIGACLAGIVSLWCIFVVVNAVLVGRAIEQLASTARADMATSRFPGQRDLLAAADDLAMIRVGLVRIMIASPLLAFGPFSSLRDTLSGAVSASDCGQLIEDVLSQFPASEVSPSLLFSGELAHSDALEQWYIATAGQRGQASADLAQLQAILPHLEDSLVLRAMGIDSSHLATIKMRVQQAAILLDLVNRAGTLLDLSAHLPASHDSPRRYLLVTQNEREVRPTGGFMGTYGVLEVSRGQVRLLDFQSTYAIDSPDVALEWPPLPLALYGNTSHLYFRDANWDPDFPRSALLMTQLYFRHRHQRIDGIVSMDMRAFASLLDLLGPLSVPGYPLAQHLSGATFADIADFYSHDHNPGSTKPFLALAAHTLMQRANHLHLTHNQLLDAARIGRDLLAHRDIQLFVTDTSAEADLMRLGLSGAMAPSPAALFTPDVHDVHDTNLNYLSVINANTGHNKINNHLSETISYTIASASVPDGHRLLATLLVTYHNSVDPSHWPVYDGTSVAATFVRVYVPMGSSLVMTRGLDQQWFTTTVSDSYFAVGPVGHFEVSPLPFTIFSGFLAIRPGQTRHVTWTYLLPPMITPHNDQLYIRSQAGTAPVRTSVQLLCGFGRHIQIIVQPMTDNYLMPCGS